MFCMSVMCIHVSLSSSLVSPQPLLCLPSLDLCVELMLSKSTSLYFSCFLLSFMFLVQCVLFVFTPFFRFQVAGFMFLVSRVHMFSCVYLAFSISFFLSSLPAFCFVWFYCLFVFCFAINVSPSV